MPAMRRVFFLLLLPLCTVYAGGKPDLVTIRLHAEGNPAEGELFVTPITLMNPPKQTVIRKVPIITERDIVAFYPFSAPDGSIACYFKLDADGTHRLEEHTTEYRDTLVVALINGRLACSMMVDKRITDGIVLIASGFLPVEIAQLQLKYPTMGNEKGFGDQKKKAEMIMKEVRKNTPKPTPAPKVAPNN